MLLLPTPSDACGDPPRYQSMRLKGAPQDSYSPGDKVEYECRPGYKRHHPLRETTAVCQPDNTWTPLQEACTRKSCPRLADPLNGQVNGTFLFGSTAHFVCNEGFYLVGPKILHCDLHGDTVDWDDAPPICEKVLCKPPAQIPNGKYSNSHKDTFEYNEVVTYSCNPSGGPDEYSLVGERQLICLGPDEWSSEPPECKVVKCPYPALKNGRIVSGFGKKFYYKAKVVLECLPGFSLKGNDTIVCGADNRWEPDLPECITVPTPSSTKSPTSSHSVPVPPSSKPTTSTAPGSSPGTSTVTPRTPHPPSADTKNIILIAVASVAAVALLCICIMCAFLKKKKKRTQENQ